MLNIFSCAYWPCVCLPWRNVYLCLLPADQQSRKTLFFQKTKTQFFTSILLLLKFIHFLNSVKSIPILVSLSTHKIPFSIFLLHTPSAPFCIHSAFVLFFFLSYSGTVILLQFKIAFFFLLPYQKSIFILYTFFYCKHTFCVSYSVIFSYPQYFQLFCKKNKQTNKKNLRSFTDQF